ncbi:MAG: ABC transporter substrate-binding protein [Bacteroidetes bacterium]|nr:ABC transporter substrate-binding protein [Bacteroidota bacterium]MCY4205399.1 ABC transporter substrate-binding protein [Bacteroidota bacterium]
MRINLLLVVLFLSACQSNNQADLKKQVEVFSWWTSGSEAAALESVLETYRALYPDVEVVNASIAGGGGSAARPVLQTRLIGGIPPDTWQTHHGAELMGQYVAPGFAASLKDLYAAEGWHELFSPSLIDMISNDGEPYLVVLNLHRSNTLWYNKPVLTEYGFSIGESLDIDELFEILEQLNTTDVSPMCMGDTGIWATGIMFENTLLGTIGPDRYLGLWNGTTSFMDTDVMEAIRIYDRLLDYLNSDHAALSWDQAADKMASGDCVFYSMGDWAYGEFIRDGLQENIDFGWVAHPGSDGIHLLVTDGFTMAKDAPNPQETLNMLRVMGDRVVQEDFNLLKGSICARNDCDRSRFGPYLQWAMDEYAKGVAVPTVIHGSAAPADFQQALNDALTDFVVRRNKEAFAKTLANEAKVSGFGS